MTEIIEIALYSAGMMLGGGVTGAVLMDQHHRRLLAAREAERRRADEREAGMRRMQAEQTIDLQNARAQAEELRRARAMDESYALGIETGMQMGANSSAASEFLRVVEGGKGAAFIRRRTSR